jgi:hypothetical protein
MDRLHACSGLLQGGTLWSDILLRVPAALGFNCERYRIDDNAGEPMLVLDATLNSNSSESQKMMVTLPADSSEAKSQVHDDCIIQGGVFSIHPDPGSDSMSWIIRSPTTAGWDRGGEQMDVNAQWRLFVRELARMHDRRCFPSGVSTQFVRSAIAETIPLPANPVPTFTYSDQGERFVNLASGMEVRIQKVSSTGTASNVGTSSSLRIMTVDHDVVTRHGGAIGLRLSHHPGGVQGVSLGKYN